MNEGEKALRLDTPSLEQHRHICVLYNSQDEEFGVLRSFIKDGFKKKDKSFHIIDEASRRDYLRRMEGLGIDVATAQATGQLEVRGWQDAHLRSGHFDQHAMLALVDEVLTDSGARGYPFTRWVANMGWALQDAPGVDDVVEYCTRLNHVTPKHKATIICTYDYAKFSVNSMIDVIRTHPAAIIGGIVHQNPYHVPADVLLQELQERRKRPRA